MSRTFAGGKYESAGVSEEQPSAPSAASGAGAMGSSAYNLAASTGNRAYEAAAAIELPAALQASSHPWVAFFHVGFKVRRRWWCSCCSRCWCWCCCWCCSCCC